MITIKLFLTSFIIYLLAKYKINKIKKRAPKCYHGHAFFEFLSGFFDRHTNPILNLNKNKIPDKPCLFIMNHLDISDPLFILQIIKLQKTPRKLIYVATTEFHKYPFVKRLLEEDECILVEFADIPEGLTEQQLKMGRKELECSSLSIEQKEKVINYQQQKQLYADRVISDMIDRLSSGYNVFIFPTGSFDHYNHKPDMIRSIRPGAAKAILKCIDNKIDAEVLILKKDGIPERYAGSFFWSLPYMILGGSRKVKMSLEAAIPINFFEHELIKTAKDPIRIITALYASYLSTEYLSSPCKTRHLPIKPLRLKQDELDRLLQLRNLLEQAGYTGTAVQDQNIKDNNSSLGLDIENNPFLGFIKK